MSVYTMVVLIVLIATIGRVVASKSRSRHVEQAPVASADTMRLTHEVQQLKERIQVLERVITDNHSSVDLDRQIERLRDR